MQVFVPYAGPAPTRSTVAALEAVSYAAVETRGANGYCEFFEERWSDRSPFIVVEHDVVVWPGALERIWLCPNPWCAYAVSEHEILAAPNCVVPLCAVKIGTNLIDATKNLWRDLADKFWGGLDGALTRAARAAGFTPCQHQPGVVNVRAA